MDMAMRESMRAADKGEVPVGAVIVSEDGQVLGKAHNQVETLCDATAHAEILAITQANAALGDWRLEGCTLYVTKEPCPMCSGAIVFSRLKRIVWGLSDPNRGGHSAFGLLNSTALNHRPEILPGFREAECKSLFQNFFREVRAKRRDKPDGSRC